MAELKGSCTLVDGWRSQCWPTSVLQLEWSTKPENVREDKEYSSILFDCGWSGQFVIQDLLQKQCQRDAWICCQEPAWTSRGNPWWADDHFSNLVKLGTIQSNCLIVNKSIKRIIHKWRNGRGVVVVRESMILWRQ